MNRLLAALALILAGCGGPTARPTPTPVELRLPVPPEMARLARENGQMRAVLNACGSMIARYQREREQERQR